MHNSSFYLVKLLLYTNLTPNQITSWGIIIGLFGVALITSANAKLAVVGYLIMVFYWLTDYSDGKVARHKNTTSSRGKYYDYIGHLLVSPLMFLAVGVQLFNLSGDVRNILLGTAATLFYIWHGINGKLPRLITGQRGSQLYQENKGISLMGIALKIHKNLIFNVHLVFIFLAAQLLIYFHPALGLTVTYYMLLGYTIIFATGFLYGIFLYGKRLDSYDKK